MRPGTKAVWVLALAAVLLVVIRMELLPSSLYRMLFVSSSGVSGSGSEVPGISGPAVSIIDRQREVADGKEEISIFIQSGSSVRVEFTADLVRGFSRAIEGLTFQEQSGAALITSEPDLKIGTAGLGFAVRLSDNRVYFLRLRSPGGSNLADGVIRVTDRRAAGALTSELVFSGTELTVNLALGEPTVLRFPDSIQSLITRRASGGGSLSVELDVVDDLLVLLSTEAIGPVGEPIVVVTGDGALYPVRVQGGPDSVVTERGINVSSKFGKQHFSREISCIQPLPGALCFSVNVGAGQPSVVVFPEEIRSIGDVPSFAYELSRDGKLLIIYSDPIGTTEVISSSVTTTSGRQYPFAIVPAGAKNPRDWGVMVR